LLLALLSFFLFACLPFNLSELSSQSLAFSFLLFFLPLTVLFFFGESLLLDKDSG